MHFKKVLLNFECGSKQRPFSPFIYPETEQKALLSLLQADGYLVTVLTDRPKAYSCPTSYYDTLEELEWLLKLHNIFVGIDSFPVRYSIYLLNQPAIYLFSSFDRADYLPGPRVLTLVRIMEQTKKREFRNSFRPED
jgi:hypothetical protein